MIQFYQQYTIVDGKKVYVDPEIVRMTHYLIAIELATWLNWLVGAYAQSLFTLIKGLAKRIFVKSTALVIKSSVKNLLPLTLFLKNHSLACYYQLVDIATEDTPKQKNRFRVNYIFSSLIYCHKVIVTLTAHELHYIPSLVPIFLSAGWLEREIWDLYGLYFSGNCDLRRILTDYGFSGHPLRKDFPLSGFSEIYYSLDQNRIVVVPIELAQAYRIFTV